MKKMTRLAGVLAAMIAVVGFARPALTAEPVQITYGYHPYWTGAWYGVILKKKELWKKYLPPGSTVKFEPHLTGPPMINAMLADKMHIGTMGDMPSLVLSTKQKIADVRLVSVTMLSNGQTCNKFLVGKSAPQFNDYNDAMKWMSGKPFAYHRGTCANRATESIIAKGVFKPSEILVMPIEVIASNFEAGKLTAGIMWEPHARRQVELGNARYAATGAPWHERDANFTSMRQDFIEKHPEAAAGWLKAEIEALQFLLSNPRESVKIIASELTGYDERTVWAALYEANPAIDRWRSGQLRRQTGLRRRYHGVNDDRISFSAFDKGDRVAGDARERDQPGAAEAGNEGDGCGCAAGRNPRTATRRVPAVGVT